MGEGLMCGTMGPNIVVIGLKIRSMEEESMNGQMVENTMENGRTTTCMGGVFIPGRMGGSMMESTLMIGNMALGSILGRIAGSIWGNG